MKHWILCCAAALGLAACAERTVDEEPPEGSGPAQVDAPLPPPAATVQLNPTQGNAVSGSLNVTAVGNGVRLTGTLRGLPPEGSFGFHFHENGDCSAPDASSAGAHFNPTNQPHGNPEGDAHHAGDMANLTSDAQGVVQVDAQIPDVTLSNGAATDVMRRALVVHAQPDDYSSQPSGNSGARIACGTVGG